jgi:hypothetical protein
LSSSHHPVILTLFYSKFLSDQHSILSSSSSYLKRLKKILGPASSKIPHFPEEDFLQAEKANYKCQKFFKATPSTGASTNMMTSPSLR